MRRTSFPMTWLWVVLLLVLVSMPAGLVAVDVDAERSGKGEEPLHRNHTTNLHPRYQTGSKRAVKEQRLLVQISITSSPHRAHLRAAARSTWLLPCITSARCDYRFFIDVPDSQLALPTHAALVLEAARHEDVVFRSSCSLMSRHPDVVNYGNALPIPEPQNGTNVPAPVTLAASTTPSSPASTVTSSNASRRALLDEADEAASASAGYPYDYPFRRFYKVDWKVCFVRFWSGLTGAVKTSRGKGKGSKGSTTSSSSSSSSIEGPRPYHVFVEDDSFVCSENLFFQLARLEERMRDLRAIAARGSGSGSRFIASVASNDTTTTTSNGTANSLRSASRSLDDDAVQPGQRERGRPFRTGTLMFDGFDDSSTIMSGEVGDAFLQQYPHTGYLPQYPRTDDAPFYPPHVGADAASRECWECPHVKVRGAQSSTAWLSWGNSWKSDWCNWRRCLSLAPSSLAINEPATQCFSTNAFVLRTFGFLSSGRLSPANQTISRRHYNASTAPEMFNASIVQSFAHTSGPCQPNFPLIYHHPRAAVVLLHRAAAESTRHICERMLLVDKVKEPPEMFTLWNTAVGDDFRDFSEVLMHDKHYGWYALLSATNRSRLLSASSTEKHSALRPGAGFVDQRGGDSEG